MDWSDRIVVVTGGGGGMGHAVARRFAKAGATTFILGRTLESLEETAGDFPNLIPLASDVSDPKSVEETMALILKKGVPFALIHTAGINSPDRFMAHQDPGKVADAETWKRILETNTLGVANMISAVSGPMTKNGGGRIVVVTSLAGHGFDSFAGVPYTASKWAVRGLLFTARPQLATQGIVVSEYAPGETNTPIVEKRPVKPTQLHRDAMIQTDDCAEALFFIASQSHSMSVIQMPAYQPYGGMPPEIPAPWLDGLEIRNRSNE